MNGIYGFIQNDDIIYIGQSTNIRHRENCHLSLLKRNKHYNIYLQRCYNNNPDDFSLVLIHETDILTDMEIFFINLYSPKCNLNIPLDDTSYTWSESSRKKLGASLKGRIPWNKGVPRTDEEKSKMSASRIGKVPWNMGIPCSEETKRKIGLANTGKKRTEECKEHTSIYMKQHPNSGQFKKKELVL